MKFRRYVWLGDGPKGYSIYWDTKKNLPMKGKTSSIISASGSKNNGFWASMLVVPIILILGAAGSVIVPEGAIHGKAPVVILGVVSWIIGVMYAVLLNKLMYAPKDNLTPATLKQAQIAIKSTGYLTNESKPIAENIVSFSSIIAMVFGISIWPFLPLFGRKFGEFILVTLVLGGGGVFVIFLVVFEIRNFLRKKK